MLDRVVHTLFVVVVALVSVGLGKPEWKKYTSKNSGRHDFQVDLAIALMNYAIAQDWDGGSERPSWMRQRTLCPVIVESAIFASMATRLECSIARNI